jgi:integrase
MIADMVRIQRLSGCRPGELLAMTADQIDRSDPESWTFAPSEHKTSHHDISRVVMIGPRAIAILAPWLLQAGSNRIFTIERDGYRQAIIRACARAFPHPTLSAIPAKELTDAQKTELKAWNKTHRWHPNMLRHAFATQVRREHGLEAAQVLLGHSRADVTQVYAERDVRKAQDVARKIG